MDKPLLRHQLRAIVGLPKDPREGRKYACCRLAKNMRREETGRDDLDMERCICGRRHFTARAEPGTLGLRGSSINEAQTGRFVKV